MRTRSSFSSRCAAPPRASRAAFGNVDDTSFACIIRVAPRIALRRSAKSDADADTIYHGSELLATQTPQPASHPPCSDTAFCLRSYGHKLPVMALDISSDSRLIITGSADKNVKIWGLDFGDCHKSIFAHSDSIMTVGFVPGTHYFFSAGKDRMIKYWDGDKFDQILTVPGHHGEVCPRFAACCLSRHDTRLAVPACWIARICSRKTNQFFSTSA